MYGQNLGVRPDAPVNRSLPNFARGFVTRMCFLVLSFRKIGWKCWSCGGSKFRLSHWKGTLLIQQLVATAQAVMLALFLKVPKTYRLMHCRLTPSLQRTSANIRINFILPETSVPELRVCRWLTVWVSGFVFTQLLSKVTVSDARRSGVKIEFNVKWPFKIIQDHVFWDGITGKLYEGLRILMS